MYHAMLKDTFLAKQATKIMGCAANNQKLLEQEYEQFVRDTALLGDSALSHLLHEETSLSKTNSTS